MCVEVGSPFSPARQVPVPTFGRREQQPLGEMEHLEVKDTREVCDCSEVTVSRSV